MPCLNRKNGFATYEREIASRILRDYDDLDVDILAFSGIFGRFRRPKAATDELMSMRNISFPSFLAFPSRPKRIRRLAKLLFRPFKKLFSFNYIMGGSEEDVYVFFENAMTDLKLKGKTAVVLHDIIPLRLVPDPTRLTLDCINETSIRMFSLNAANIVKNADKIITVSEFSRKDIADYFHIDESKIEVVYNAVNVVAYSGKYDYAALREKHGLPEKYILYFGACHMRKNVETLIRSYALLPEEIRRTYKLVITNPWADTIACVEENGVADYVHYIFEVPEEDKPAIYQMASLFVWPSIYEGFGLPILEAMAAGVPVICSNVTSHPEVAGSAAILVEPYDTHSIASQMQLCLTDETLRQELIAKGYENIKRFSWDDSARKLHDIIINL